MLKLIALAALAAAPAGEQFDLVCKSPETSARYRVDLAANEWCEGDCAVTQKIASVTTNQLTLKEVKGQRPGDDRALIAVNRISGAWDWQYASYGLIRLNLNYQGTCAPAAFSGFGSEKAKF